MSCNTSKNQNWCKKIHDEKNIIILNEDQILLYSYMFPPPLTLTLAMAKMLQTQVSKG